jgi:hypothetical protein
VTTNCIRITHTYPARRLTTRVSRRQIKGELQFSALARAAKALLGPVGP